MRRNTEYTIHSEEGQFILFSEENKESITITAEEKFLLEHYEITANIQILLEALMDEFSMSRKDAARKTVSFTQDLLAKQIIVMDNPERNW